MNHLDDIGGRTRPQTDEDRVVMEKFGDSLMEVKPQGPMKLIAPKPEFAEHKARKVEEPQGMVF